LLVQKWEDELKGVLLLPFRCLSFFSSKPHKMSMEYQNTKIATQIDKNENLPEVSKDESPSDLPQTKQEENEDFSKTRRGRISGGSFLEGLHESDFENADEGPLKEVEIDLPLTLWEIQKKDDQEYIVLKFTESDKQDPFNWSISRKAWITLLLCLMTLFIGLATTAYSSGIDSMTTDLGVSAELGQLGLFCFNFACAIAPLFLAPFCELVGRRVIYVGAYACFVIMFIGLALGKNIATILVMRTLSGLFGCVGTILVGGTFSDIYRPDQRAEPMACFSYVAILGTVGAPIYAGFINETIGWRWIEGIQGLANIPLLIIIFISLRETRGGVTLHKRAKALRQATGDKRWKSKMDLEAKNIKEMLHSSSIKAVHLLVTEPVVFAFGLWIAFAWFITFLFLSVIPITFQEKRRWSAGVAGLPYISLCIGVTIGFAANFLQIRKYKSIMNSRDRKILPESRLYGAMCGAGFLPIGLFIYSFTQYGYLPWIAPTVALAPIAIGIFFIFESTYSFTSDCYGENSSSAIAGQGLMRNTLGGVAPLFASQFFHNVGSQYAGLILALAGTILTFIPFIMFKYGHVLRERSRLARSQLGGDEQKEATGLYPAPFV
jgi:MFS family permease